MLLLIPMLAGASESEWKGKTVCFRAMDDAAKYEWPRQCMKVVAEDNVRGVRQIRGTVIRDADYTVVGLEGSDELWTFFLYYRQIIVTNFLPTRPTVR